jgi:2,3-dihydroxyphenylpropionate 1,2-dioxygenase
MSDTRPLFACVSHSPLIVVRKREPEAEKRILADCLAVRAQVEAFAPDYIVMFSNDHFANFHYSNMPVFCIGTAAVAVDDVGGTPGKLNVPADDALALAGYLRGAGFDTAISYKMGVDHGFSQPLARLFGALDRWPVIPVFISPFTSPLVAFRRSRELGEAVGRFIAQSGKRVLVMGSGGISHHPIRYYPTPDIAPPDVYGWQLDGENGGTMTEAEWFERLDTLHHQGAQSIVDGERTAADMRLNETFDRDFLDRIARADLASMDEWNQGEILANAGVGALEIHNWIAARAAHAAAGGGEVTTKYDFVLEYAVGYGLAHSA